MKPCVLILACLTMETVAAPVLANDVYAAGPLYGANGFYTSGGIVSCRIFNPGPGILRIISRQIYDNAGNLVGLNGGDTCAAAVGVAKSCSFSTYTGGNLAFSCRAITSAGVASGLIDIQDTNNTLLATSPMQLLVHSTN